MTESEVGGRSAPSVTVVMPTIGRPALARALAPIVGRLPVVVVDDRPGEPSPLAVPGVTGLRSGGRGPAAARNTGWRACTSQWVAFVDDDVEPPPGWVDALLADLAAAQDDVGGVQGRIVVPRVIGRGPTDVERATIGLEDADWATADLAYRRAALVAVDGFCEGFGRAYREDADLGLRVIEAGWRITTGHRQVVHPIKPGDRWTSVRAQRGNLDDVLMRRRHGAGWRRRAHVPRGRRPWHLATTVTLVGAPVLAATGARRTAVATGLAWLTLTADFTRRRVAPGPRTADEVLTMALTSVVIPPVATGWWLRGWWRHGVHPAVGAGGR